MRVIAGELGGRRLRTPAGPATRPTAERVREALFSILGEIGGVRALDLFAGSGALGIEALSRGAVHATFVDTAAASVAALRENVATLGLTQRARVVHRDALAWAASAGGAGEHYDLVFLDPPYKQSPQLGAALSRTLPALLGPAARVISESDRRSPLELACPITFERRYGDTLIRIHNMREQ